jgi:MFS family permease
VPAIVADLGGANQQAWIASAYLLMSGAWQPVWGRMKAPRPLFTSIAYSPTEATSSAADKSSSLS